MEEDDFNTTLTPGINTKLDVTFTAPSAYDVDGFLAIDDWEPFVEVSSIPEHGPSSTSSEVTRLRDGLIRKIAGATNYGSLAIPFSRAAGDPGQELVRQARDLGATIYCREVYSEGSTYFFSAKVTTFTRSATVDAPVSGTATFEIDNKDVYVPPPASIFNFRALNPQANRALLRASTSHDEGDYSIAVTGTESTPSVEAIKAGTGAVTTATGAVTGFSFEATVEGLEPVTNYWAHVVQTIVADGRNRDSTPVTAFFRTKAAT